MPYSDLRVHPQQYHATTGYHAPSPQIRRESGTCSCHMLDGCCTERTRRCQAAASAVLPSDALPVNLTDREILYRFPADANLAVLERWGSAGRVQESRISRVGLHIRVPSIGHVRLACALQNTPKRSRSRQNVTSHLPGTL